MNRGLDCKMAEEKEPEFTSSHGHTKLTEQLQNNHQLKTDWNL